MIGSETVDDHEGTVKQAAWGVCLGYHVICDGCACTTSKVCCNVPIRRYRRQSYLCVCVGIKKRRGVGSVVKRHVCYRPALSKVY